MAKKSELAALQQENARLRYALNRVRGYYVELLMNSDEDDYEGQTSICTMLALINVGLDHPAAKRLAEPRP